MKKNNEIKIGSSTRTVKLTPGKRITKTKKMIKRKQNTSHMSNASNRKGCSSCSRSKRK